MIHSFERKHMVRRGAHCLAVPLAISRDKEIAIDGALHPSLLDDTPLKGNTWGNPTSVVDQQTSKTWPFMLCNNASHNQNGDNSYAEIDSLGNGLLMPSERANCTKWNQHKRRWKARGSLSGRFNPFEEVDDDAILGGQSEPRVN